MPSAPDHHRFASAVLDGSAVRNSFLGRNAGCVLLGTQGPDPFYFYGTVPWRPRAEVSGALGFAEFLHGSAPAAVFPVLAARAAEAPDADAAFAYLFGLSLHYLLDRALHPYVFYRSGFDERGGLEGGCGVDHARFETLLAEAGRGAADVRETGPRRMFSGAGRETAAADALLAESFPERARPGLFADAWRDMRTAQSVLWDPCGVKLRLVGALGGGATKAHAMIRPRRLSEAERADLLNEANGPWRDPVSGLESTASVAELTASAAEDAGKAAAFLLRLRGGEKPADGWEALLGGRNHDGHAPGELKRYRAKPFLHR